MRDLIDRFIGRSVAESSARAMDTLGKDIRTASEAVTKFGPEITDQAKVMDNVLDYGTSLQDAVSSQAGFSADPTTTTTSSSGGTQTTTTQSSPPSSSPPSSPPPSPPSSGGGGGYGGGY